MGRVCGYCGSIEIDSTRSFRAPSRALPVQRSAASSSPSRSAPSSSAPHIPLHKWLLAAYLLCATKKGISAHQLHRMLGITYKTAWFMAHRIREAMRDGTPGPMAATGKIVEADETYIGTGRRQAAQARTQARLAAQERVVMRWSSAAARPARSMSTAPTRQRRAEIVAPTSTAKSRLMTDEGQLLHGHGQRIRDHTRP